MLLSYFCIYFVFLSCFSFFLSSFVLFLTITHSSYPNNYLIIFFLTISTFLFFFLIFLCTLLTEFQVSQKSLTLLTRTPPTWNQLQCKTDIMRVLHFSFARDLFLFVLFISPSHSQSLYLYLSLSPSSSLCLSLPLFLSLFLSLSLPLLVSLYFSLSPSLFLSLTLSFSLSLSLSLSLFLSLSHHRLLFMCRITHPLSTSWS